MLMLYGLKHIPVISNPVEYLLYSSGSIGCGPCGPCGPYGEMGDGRWEMGD